jgi:hypothetical protein
MGFFLKKYLSSYNKVKKKMRQNILISKRTTFSLTAYSTETQDCFHIKFRLVSFPRARVYK